jgi:hypothetical protein
MDKILKDIELRAETGDPRASEAYFATLNMTQQELADYVAAHDSELREILDVRNLADKEGNPELAKEYFELLNQGQKQAKPDKFRMNDFYGGELKDIPYYMEKFGYPKENGEYPLKSQIDFVKDIGNLDESQLRNLAYIEGFHSNPEQMRDEIARAGQRLTRDIANKGYDAETGSWLTPRYFAKGAVSLAAPRVSEAHEAGQDASMADILGDAVEFGANFAPGFNVASKAARVASKVPVVGRVANSVGGRILAEGAESAAVPIASQLYDMAAYEEGDPRSEFDPMRVGSQYSGALAAKGMMKLAGTRGKQLLENEGKKSSSESARALMDVAENIGDVDNENIARRELALQRKADLARNTDYNSQQFLTAKQNKTGHFATVDDLADYEDFLIRKSEAERFANTQKAREQFDNTLRESPLVNADIEVSDDGLVTITKPDGKVERVQVDPSIVSAATGSTDDELNNAIVAAYMKKHPEMEMQDNIRKVLTAYDENPVVFQLPDGRFVSGDALSSIKGGKIYTDYFDDGLDVTNVTMLENNGDVSMPPKEPLRVKMENGREAVMTYKPRDITVRRALDNDRDFRAVASGRAKYQPWFNTGTNAVFNAASREGIVGEGLKLDDKRQAAAWNKQLMQLRPLVTGDQPVEHKRDMVDAIMNVMNYGLDGLPEEVFRRNPLAYKAIAKQLGSGDWSHWSEHKVKDYPTTSY